MVSKICFCIILHAYCPVFSTNHNKFQMSFNENNSEQKDLNHLFLLTLKDKIEAMGHHVEFSTQSF